MKLGKLGLLGASFGTYAVLFSWKFAVVILASLFFHECGHLWAMKRAGMRTKGVYFIPFLGAAAVADDAFPSAESEAVVALMGPIWGFALALATYGAYLATGVPLIAAIAGWMAFLNLFNLLPINPLDGGRVAHSLVRSISSRAAMAYLALGVVVALALAVYVKLTLFVFVAFIGAIEWLGYSFEGRKQRDRVRIIAALAKFFGVEARAEAVAVAWNAFDAQHSAFSEDEWCRMLDAARSEYPGLENITPCLQGSRFLPMRIALAAQEERYYGLFKRRGRAFSFNCTDMMRGKFENRADFLLEKPRPVMTGKEIALAFVGYVGLCIGLSGLLYFAARVPAATAAWQIFKS